MTTHRLESTSRARAGRPLALVAVVACLGAGHATAEVRAVPGSGSARVLVQATAKGPWTAVGAVDDSVLNPLGDIRGDGSPAHSVLNGLAVVAWHVPSEGVLRVARHADGVWSPVANLPAPTMIGTPVLLTSDDSLFVLHRGVSAGGGLSVHLRSVGSSQPPSEETVFEGSELLDAWSDDTGVRVLLLSSSMADLDEIVLVSLPAPLPPIELVSVQLDILPDGLLAPTVRESFRRRGGRSEATLLGWWADERRLRYVVLEANGLTSPVREVEAVDAGRAGHQTLVRAALQSER